MKVVSEGGKRVLIKTGRTAELDDCGTKVRPVSQAQLSLTFARFTRLA